MNRIYLDWGVVSNLKRQGYGDIMDFFLSNKEELFIVYSPAHFVDAMRSEGDERFCQDIETLEALAGDHLLSYTTDGVRPYLATPSEYYRDHKGQNLDIVPDFSEQVASVKKDFPSLGVLLQSVLSLPFPIPSSARSNNIICMMLPNLPETPSVNDVIKSGVEFINRMLCDKDYYKTYRKLTQETGLKLETNSGNWSADEVIPRISSIMKSIGIDKTFEEFVCSGFGNKAKIDKFQYFLAAYYLLDLIGYKSDKLPKATNAMNSVETDAQHAFYAAFCDYLVTQDSHMASKARVLYHELGIATKVITPAEAISMLQEEHQYDLTTFLREQLIEDNIEQSDDKSFVYKLSERFLGIFTHCVIHYQDDGTLLEFKLDFDNYSYFIFYEEAGIITDIVTQYFGRPADDEYQTVRKRIVAGDPNASIVWPGEDVLITYKADSDTHRPELYLKISPDIVCRKSS